MLKRYVACLVVLMPVLLAGPAHAADSRWIRSPGSPGDWYDQGNWDLGVPGDWDDAHVDNGGIAHISYGTCEANVFVGYDGTGAVHQTGGTVNPTWHIQLGQNAGSSGQYLFDGGIISGAHSNIYVGWYGHGEFVQDGGSIQSLNMLSVSRDDGSTGVYDLKSGSIESRLVKIGQHGTGQFAHTGGSFNCPDRFYLATEIDADGRYDLSGTGVLTTVTEFVGSEGLGRFRQDGGTHSISSELTLGRDGGARGEYVITGGSLDATSLRVASSGNAMFKVSGPLAAISVDTYVQASGGELISDITRGGISTIETGLVATFDGMWEVLDNGAGIGRFDVLAANGGITGNFDSVTLPGADWSWGIDTAPGGDTLWVVHVPEPATVGLLCLGAVGIVSRRRKGAVR